MIARVEPHGIYYRVRVGERSHLPGIYTSGMKAEKALKAYISGVNDKQEKRKAKKNAKTKG